MCAQGSREDTRKRPDLYLPALNVALDVKTGSLFTSKTPAHVASHTPVAATAEVFLLRAFGDPRRGSSGEYTEALRQGTTVTLLISEVTGARHSLGERFLRSCAAAYAERHPTAAGPSADRSFYSLHSSFLSTASLRGLGRQLRTKVLSSVSVSSLRRRAPTCSSSPPSGYPAPRAGGRSFC
ncbi:hypothetical protein AB1Y20_022162 [Prymnesium parvum]|uniref:Uncharacterized protein n=1 Tax=Prymnesium parvum TaxID=97485 RepID=A0AB34JGJ3_PRYPA